MRAKLEASQDEVKALTLGPSAQAEAEKAVDKEFKARLLQGYVDLKRRVALDHPDWDLLACQGANSDFWIDEPTEEALLSVLPVVVQEEVGGTNEAAADLVAADPTV